MVREIEPSREFNEPSHEKVAILDAGAQYLKPIDRRIRELRVTADILPLDTPVEQLQKYKAIIISGGPTSVYNKNAPKCDPRIFSAGKPILGICWGMQHMTHALGGVVEKGEGRDDGPATADVEVSSVLFSGLNPQQEVLMSHGDNVTQVAPGFKVIARSNGVIAAIENPQQRLYGFQFHPEVDLTKQGREMLRKFLYDIAGLSGDYQSEDQKTKIVAYIKERVGNKDVLVLASGGADTIKTHHNDSPLARFFREQGRIVEPLQELHKDEVRELGSKLGLPDKIIRRQPFPGPGLAIRIICAEKPYITEGFDQINEKLQTLVPHGVGATLIPIRTVGVGGDGRSYSSLVGLTGAGNWETLYGLAREIPRQIPKVNRVVYIFGAPIEGAVREITPTYPTKEVVNQLQIADNIVNQVLRKYNLTTTLSQVPVISFPVHFGKPGNRSIAIRTFITRDFMTGVSAIPDKDIPQEVVYEMANAIVLGVPGISRVAYDLTSKPPGTTEWE